MSGVDSDDYEDQYDYYHDYEEEEYRDLYDDYEHSDECSSYDEYDEEYYDQEEHGERTHEVQ